MKISVLIPVYKEPKFLVDLVTKLGVGSSYEDKEILVVVDGAMTPEIAEALETLGSDVKVVFPNEHRGKAVALNQAALGLTTEVLLFLDNDVLLPDNGAFLDILAQGLEKNDIVEMPKEVLVESWYSSMIGYEYQSLAMANLILAKIAGRSPGIIGSAFAVKKDLFDRLKGFRQVVHEDGDFAARAFRLHSRYSFDFRLKIKTGMPNSLSDWVKQRKRWTLINVLWFKENFLHLLKSSVQHPSLIPAVGLMLLPSVLSPLVFLGLENLNLAVLNPLVFMVGQPLEIVSGILLWFTYHMLFTQGLLSIGLGFTLSAILYGSFSLLFRFRFNLFSFAVYSFLYLPIVVVINLAMVVAFLRKTKLNLDWKT